MNFVCSLNNRSGSKYDLYEGDGINLVPHGSPAPASGYHDVPYIFKVKGCDVPDPDFEQWVYMLASKETA